jgi:hypothetical protein
MLAIVMKKKNVVLSDNKRVTFGIKIKSRVHLLNVVLYIQTARTKGQHTGSLKDCTHFGHRRPTVIPDRRTLQIFREDELDILLPEYARERREAWQKKKKGKKWCADIEEGETKETRFNELEDDD